MNHDWILNLGVEDGHEGEEGIYKWHLFFLIQQEIYVRTTRSMKLLNVDFTRFGVTCGQVGACPSWKMQVSI